MVEPAGMNLNSLGLEQSSTTAESILMPTSTDQVSRDAMMAVMSGEMAVNHSIDGLIQMCSVVADTKCGPLWAMITFNVLGGLIVFLNITHLITINATPHLRNSANAKGILNLASADMIYGCLILMMYNCPVTEFSRRIVNLPLCAGTFAATCGFLGLSGGILVLMSMERCIIICVPFVNRQNTNIVFRGMLVAVWIADVTCCVVMSWYNIQLHSQTQVQYYCFYGMGPCGFDWNDAGEYQAFIMFGCIIIFIMMMMCTNVAILIRVRQSRKFRSKTGTVVSVRNIKTAQIIGVMCLGYTFCWCCMFMWMGFRILKPEWLKPWHSHVSLMVLTSNSMMNPLIYGMASPEYRATLSNIIRKGLARATAPAELTSHNYSDVGSTYQQERWKYQADKTEGKEVTSAQVEIYEINQGTSKADIQLNDDIQQSKDI